MIKHSIRKTKEDNYTRHVGSRFAYAGLRDILVRVPWYLMSDEASRALSKALRRQVLSVLLEHEEGIDFDDLTNENLMVANQWEQNRFVLYHNHLPKLDDMGFIDWNPETQTIERGKRFDEIQALLDTPDVDDNDRFSSPTGLMVL
jgi:hypothetical protein